MRLAAALSMTAAQDQVDVVGNAEGG